MKHKFTRSLSIFAVVALLLMSFAAAAYAEDDVDGAHFTDGRINSLDIDSPVAIYAIYDYPYADDVNMGVLDRIEFWGVISDDRIEKVLDVTADDILAADSGEAVATGFGYTLYREADGSLTLVAPANADGSVYRFNWTQSY